MTLNLSEIDKNALPVWGNYEQRDKSESIEDFVPKTPYELYLDKEAEKRKSRNNANVNKQAINDIPVIPDFILAEQGYYVPELPDWYKELNVASPDEIKEWEAKGKMGLAETWQKKKKWEMIPYSGTSAEMTMILRNANTLRRIKKGEDVSNVDKELLVDFLRDIKEEEVRGGHTWLGNALSGLMTSVPYVGEFAAAIATMPEGVGFAGLGATLSGIAARKAARKAIKAEIKRLATESLMTGTKKNITGATTKALYNKALKEFAEGGSKQTLKAMGEVGGREVVKEIAKATPKAAYTSGKAYVTRTPHEFVKGIADNQLSTGVYVTDAGNAAFVDSENIATSIFKSLFSGTFDYMTETTGFMFAPLESWFAKPVRKLLPKKFFTEFDKLVNSQFGMKATEAFQKYGYDGVIEEMGEELLNRFLCQTFGINGLDQYTLDGFLNNVLYADDTSQWASEALSFAAMSGSGHVIYGANSKIAQQRNLKKLTDMANANAAQKFGYRAEAAKRLQDEFAEYLKENPLQLSRKASPEEFEQKYEDAKLAFLKDRGMSVEEYYLEQGFVKIKGSQSAAERMLRKELENRGINKEVADEFINNTSEIGIREKLKQYREEEGQDAEKRRERAVDFLANRMLDNKSYKDKKLAHKNANLFVTALEKFSETKGIAIEDLIRQEAPTIRNQSEIEEAAPETQYTEKYIEDVYKDIKNSKDEEYINIQLKNADLAEKIKYNTLTDEEFADANEFVNELEAADYIDLANELRAASGYEFESNADYMQRTEFTDDAPVVKKKEGYNQLYQSANTAGAESGEFADAAKEWKEKGTDSKYFKKWFGDSKVVDENGKPLVVYHRTKNEFERFDENLIKSGNLFGKGFYFAVKDEKNLEKSYGKIRKDVYLSVQNPLQDNTIIKREDVAPYLDAKDIDILFKGKDEVIGGVFLFNAFNARYDYNTNIDTSEVLKSLGFDGIDLRNTSGDYVAFYPEQIKSVDNRGTFDAENPNIYYQRKQINNPDQLKFNFEDIVKQEIEQQQLIFQPQSISGQSVKEEIKKEYKASDVKQEKIDAANNNEIVDTGDALLGNLKKNKKQYSWEELDGMNDLLRKKYLSKSYIYELPSAEELRKEGLSDRTIAFVYLVHSKINAKPAKGYGDKKEYQKIYFDGVHEIMQKTIDFAKKNNDLIANYTRNSARNKELFNSIFPDYENKKPYNVFTAYPDLNRKAIIVGGNKLVDALYLGYGTEKDITNALALVNKEKESKTQQKSELEGWEKKFAVAETYRGWCIADRKSGIIISNRDLPSKEVAEQIAKQMYEYLQKNNSSFTVDYKNLRNYIPRRENNQNVKPEALIEVFGFRGINFGNWTKQSERQDFLNLAYDSLFDLAELLNLPPKALSLDGKLGLAFGAQGRSKAAGHFIPEYNEINLTRKSGAGSLAHEWWHALDFYFGDLSLNKEFSGKSALGSKEIGQLRTEIFEALKNLDEQIKYAPLTEKEVETRAKQIEQGARRNIEYYANDIKKSFAKSKNADKIAAFIDDIVKNADKIDISTAEARTEYDTKFMGMLEERRQTWANIGKISSLIYACKKLQSVRELAAAQKSYTKYYNNAKLLNTYEKGMGSGYWTSNTELGARAFASYILDKIAKHNYTNGFLVRDEKGEFSINFEVVAKKLQAKQKGEEYTGEESNIIEWYPAEPEERKRIFAAFDNLFNTIQYQKTDRGYKLYQSDNSYNSFKEIEDEFTVEELEDIGKFRNFVYDAYDNKLSKKQQSDVFVVGKTPAKLIEAGLPNRDISIGVSVINKAKSNKNADHNLDRDTIAGVYQALFNPIAVAEVKPAATEKDKSKKYAVILDLQEGDNYVMASIKINQQTKSAIVNEIKTIHSRENYVPLLDKALSEKRLLKVDRDKIKDLLNSKIHTELISDGVASLLQRIYEKQNNVKFYQSDNSYNSFKEIEDEFKEYLEFAPDDYEINNLEDALKDLGITENIPRVINTPVGAVSVRVSSIEHIINGGDSTLHNPDKSRYKSINRMFAVLERPEIITADENGKKKYIKLFKGSSKTKSQIAVVYNDENGDYVYTTIPVTKHRNYILKEVNSGNIIYKKGQTRGNISAANNIINDNTKIFNPDVNKYEGQDEDYQENLFFDNLKARDLRKVKGAYVPAENLIELFKNADESTVVHEFAHWWLDMFVKYAANNEELAADLEAIRKFVKNDGGEFTREQHETFARGFETYIRSGFAKTNRLKRIFEDFKNALLAIYDSIKQLGYTDDDMPQIQNLFDRLLTSERERIKTAVFDKVAEIDAKIEEIKANEVKELAELDEIYKGYEAYNDIKSQKKRSVQEYLELADTIPFRETKEIKEYKQRYKDVTFAILEKATGYKRQFIANPKNWDKVEAAFESNDNISASDDFLPEWGEFYSDTGVSYENNEIDGDYKLAQQAFDVMKEGSYNKPLDEDYQYADIDRFLTKFDYLNAKIKTLKGTQKLYAFEALMSLFNDIPSMPSEITAELYKKLNVVKEDYEEQQKEDFNRKVFPSIPLMLQLQFYITKKLGDLKVYNPETRYKMKLTKSHRLYRYIKDVKSVNSAKKQIRRINEFVIDDMRNNQRSLLHKEIQKQIKVNSKIVKVGTINKGKFDWKTNTVFAELVQMNKMKREDAERELGNLIQIQDAEKGENRDSYNENETAEFNKTNDFQDILRKMFLQYRSMRIQDLDVTHTKELLNGILELKDAGRKAKDNEDVINKTQKWNTRNNLLDILEVTKNSGKIGRFGAKWVAGVGKVISLNGGTLANWESLLNAIFDKDTAQKYSLLQDDANSEVYARKHMLDFYKRAAEIYGFKPASTWDKFLDYDYMQPLIKLMQEYNNEKYTYMQQVFSVNSPDGYARSEIEISRAQMITMFAWSLNEQLEQRLFTQFGLQQIREMFEERLSEQDRQLAWALIDTCEGMREDINEVFIRTTGLSLPAVENYFPSKAERVQSDIDMYHDFFVKSSNPSFIKQRKVCNRIPMKPLAPLEILIPHINKTAKYVVMSEHVNFLNQVFKDTAIKTKMQEIWGSKDGADIYQTLINKLAACTFTNYSKGTNLVAGTLDTLSRNYITSSIGFSPKVAMGQLLSVINYAENMPSIEWVKGFAATLQHPVESFKYMMDNCEYLQTRLAGNSQNEIIAILTSEKDKFRTVRNFMTSNVKWGDMIAITLGGKAYVDWLMKQGMSKEDAFAKFVENTLRAQQSGTTSSISEWQSAQAKNCITRMFFAFRNTDIQYERKFVDTIIQAAKSDISKKEAIKKLFIYKIFNPFMFTSFLQNLSIIALISAAFSGDDADDIAVDFFKSAIEAVLLSGMSAYGFAGYIASSFMESLIAVYDDEYKNFETAVPVMTDFERKSSKFFKGNFELADWIDALARGTEVTLGLPARKIVNSAEGVGNIAQGKIGVGLSRLAGWGEYTSTKAWTGEAPEKKRRKRR